MPWHQLWAASGHAVTRTALACAVGSAGGAFAKDIGHSARPEPANFGRSSTHVCCDWRLEWWRYAATKGNGTVTETAEKKKALTV